MPFIGKDWRSPGEAWVKTSDGWERQKILEHRLRESQARYSRNTDNQLDSGFDGDDSEKENECPYDSLNSEILNSTIFTDWQPHCQITLKNTKEVAGYNLISEAFQQLDFRNAIHDIRRFNYICKLLHLLINQNLTALSGRGTQVMFALLEEVARQVASNQQNIHILHMLLNDLKKYLKKYYCWGRPLGSTVLWKQHLQTIGRICNLASRIKIKGPTDDGGRRLTDMPTEVIREILLRLNDYKDLESSGKAYDDMKYLLEEQHIWRELCRFHFTNGQLKSVLEESTSKAKKPKIDWKEVFHTLRKKYGLREEYADCLLLCRYCRCLFWKSFGHPCMMGIGMQKSITYNENESKSTEDPESLYTPVPPQAFLKFFSL